MDGVPLTQLNELEYIHGHICANVWHRDIIARINSQTGIVTSYLDLTGILPPGQIHPFSTMMRPANNRYAEALAKEAVLNGIAYDPPPPTASWSPANSGAASSLFVSAPLVNSG